MNQSIKNILILTVILVGFVVGWATRYNQYPHKPENTISDYARIGIEAGLNASIIMGKPGNRAELDAARDYARTLVEKVYPEIKFSWPELMKHEREEFKIGTPQA